MLGRLIAAYARRRSTNAVADLASMQADQATLVLPIGETQTIPTGLIDMNDILRLEPGDRVPTDGRVVQGEAYVDESSIAGESAPVLKRKGAVLVAGTVLMRSNLDMRVTLVPESNTLARMAELMPAAQGARLRVQDTADRVAAWLAPVVLVLGTINFMAWTSVGLSAANKVVEDVARAAETREAVVDAIGYAVAVLVMPCPCVIALCVPMVAVIAVAVGTRRGVLFKTVEALESAYGVSVVVFDKTGMQRERSIGSWPRWRLAWQVIITSENSRIERLKREYDGWSDAAQTSKFDPHIIQFAEQLGKSTLQGWADQGNEWVSRKKRQQKKCREEA